MLNRILFAVLLLSTIVWGQYTFTTPDTVLSKPGTWTIAANITADYGGFIARVIVDDVIITNPNGFVVSAMTTPYVNGMGFEVAASNVVLDGVIAEGFYQAVVLNGSGCKVVNCQLDNNLYGIISRGANEISSNLFVDNDGWGYSIHISSADNNQVLDNRISGGAAGITIYDGILNIVRSNHIEGSGDGIVLYASSDNRIDSTSGWTRHFGIAVMASGSGNVGVGNSIRGQFYDPRYPGFNPNIVSLPGNSIEGVEAGVESDVTSPTSFALEQNYPNPFNPTTTINYNMAQPAHVNLIVYNELGQQVATLVDAMQAAGRHSVRFNASALNTGTYIYKLFVGGRVFTKKMTLVK